ncbi:hypothetical protein NA57DRAFT_67284 [Rhizodiscina lignyota]|uniref:Beta-glucuronidase C-terminal domain-containing protein n=1 Tax=Rhizodiscina lignyota TaxID=1504668 RepID=A0A9P4I9L9_9PEZI|nr:hypothetical protein NA57DRAFT_67284 [Rhizodiscina lignyota]
MMYSILLSLNLAIALISASDLPNHIRVSIPTNVPTIASGVIDHAYPGFAIAQHAFQDYAGNLSHPNIFSRNLINSVTEKTGTAVHIRVGGTSATPGGIPAGIKLGPAWFEGFASFPGVQWTYMAHLALNTSGAEANAVAEVKEALKYIGQNLEALEVGNEVDLYPGRVRSANYSVREYIHEWMNYTSAINSQVLAAPVYADHREPWLIATTFEEGIDKNNNIKSASLHHYMETGNLPTITRQASFMNHTAIVNNLSYFSQPVNWLKQHHPDIPVYLAETNSDTASTNDTDLIGVFGSALWLADYMLYGMTLNIRRMNIQLSTGFDYTSWRPVEYFGAPPAVLPPYYAQVFVADVIGAPDDVRISNLDLGPDLLSAYTVFSANSEKIAKAVLVNLEEWNTTTTYPSPSTQVQLLTPIKGLWRIEKLTAPGAESLANITWAGTSWTYESNGLPIQVADTTEYVHSMKGVLDVRIRASEALLLTLC